MLDAETDAYLIQSKDAEACLKDLVGLLSNSGNQAVANAAALADIGMCSHDRLTALATQAAFFRALTDWINSGEELL